jgi:hypothetical protein
MPTMMVFATILPTDLQTDRDVILWIKTMTGSATTTPVTTEKISGVRAGKETGPAEMAMDSDMAGISAETVIVTDKTIRIRKNNYLHPINSGLNHPRD